MPAPIRHLEFGAFELTILNDGHFDLPTGYFTNIPQDVADALADTITIGANLWFIRSGDRRILVDTGSADALKQMFPDTGLAWGDIKKENPTDIVLTHMHADHLGGLADARAFPGCRIHVARTEWEFWTQDGLADAVPEDIRAMVQMIQQVASGFADRVVLHDGESEIAPDVVLLDLPGHTPGHSGLRLQSGEETLLIIGDAIVSEDLQFAQPEVSYALDSNKDQAVTTRRALLQDCVEKNCTIAATHFAFPGVGKVVAEGAEFRFVPM
ncbi:MBL fold metallo-hydrolase [Tropicimonas marinistellae]|uniref:MBL fold metallo-hydrolase n=1 Tax=Tropicimonas marinistellae TaxID=1739787 RepID=UPI00082D8033|nr:MBL fold metallo-hydrolase [Tropicimonas marinistellae]